MFCSLTSSHRSSDPPRVTQARAGPHCLDRRERIGRWNLTAPGRCQEPNLPESARLVEFPFGFFELLLVGPADATLPEVDHDLREDAGEPERHLGQVVLDHGRG